MPADFDDEDLASLSESERAQLKELEAGEQAARQDLQDIAGGDDDDDDDDGKGDDASIGNGGGSGSAGGDEGGAGAAASGKASDGKDSGQGSNSSQQADQEPPAPKHSPIYQAQAPSDVGDQIKALNKDRASLLSKFTAGELNEEEFAQQDADLQEKRDALIKATTKAEVAAEMTEQQAAQAYSSTLKSFFAEQKKAGFDYHDETNKAALQHLDARVKALGELYEDNPEGWRELLAEAHAMTAKKFDIKAAAKPQRQEQQERTRQNRMPDLSAVPPTVARAPAAADPAARGDEFAYLDNLDGLALEKAVAKLSPEQAERWANR